jgi:hypothetical protein
MKKRLLKGFAVATIAVAMVFTISLTTVNAKSVYEEYSLETSIDETQEFTLEEMLNYAILDEYLAEAEYLAIIETFGEIKPFTNIILAEQRHIDLLLPLFDAYDIEVPQNNAVDSVVIPDTITSALATGVEAEEYNILMYETFLAQDNLPDDVREAFEYLMNASINHLSAFSSDHYSFIGTDMMNKFKNAFQKKQQASKGGENSEANAYRGSQGSNSSQGNSGNCPN